MFDMRLRQNTAQRKRRKKQKKEKPYTTKVVKKGTKVRIGDKKYTYFYYWKNPGNCKLCTFDHLGKALRSSTDEVVEAITNLSKGDKVFFVNLINESDVNILMEHFQLVYLNKVPIGYRGGYQYHALFMKKGLSGEYAKRLNKYIANQNE